MKITTIKASTFCIAAILFSSPLTAAPEWDHTPGSQGANGDAWGAIEDGTKTTVPSKYPYAECGIGSHQSPVAIDLTSNVSGDATAARLEKVSSLLNIQYVSDSTPDFFNSSHAAQVNLPISYTGKLWVGRDAYPLIQFHFHAPSEHTVQTNQGIKQYAGELHFVHTRADGKIAVLGVFLDDKDNKANSTFQEVLDNMPTTGGVTATPTGIQLNPMALLPKGDSKVFTYAGSLTTPPCSEGVNWYVFAEPLKVSSAQIAQLQGIYNYGNRYTQNINGRVVQIHQAGHIEEEDRR